MSQFPISKPSNTIHATPRNELTITFDRSANLITVVGTGFWTPAYVSAHIREFEGVLIQARRHERPSRTLVDLRGSAIQTTEVAAMLHEAMCRMYRAPERAAIVVSSNLVKLQMKRGFNSETHSVFISHSAAELWLSADRLSDRAA